MIEVLTVINIVLAVFAVASATVGARYRRDTIRAQAEHIELLQRALAREQRLAREHLATCLGVSKA